SSEIRQSLSFRISRLWRSGFSLGGYIMMHKNSTTGLPGRKKEGHMVRQHLRSGLRKIALVGVFFLVGACLPQKSSAITSAEDGKGVDETLDWNAHLIDGLFTAGTTPPPALRIAAIMNIAMFDAANAVTHRSRPFHFDLDA